MGPTLVTECTPDSANLSEKDPTRLRWYKGNCAAASTGVAAKYTKVVYGDAGCEYTAYPYVSATAGDTIEDAKCETGVAFPGASASTSVKYYLTTNKATCAYVAPATLMDCPVTNDFFKCSNKFTDDACTTDNKVEQTGAESNYTAQKVNDAMLTTCTATTVNGVTTYTKGQCDTVWGGYFVNKFLDADCLYNDTSQTVDHTQSFGPKVCSEITPALSPKEYANYFATGASDGGCTITEAQQYGAKPFMMAASAALVAAASMF